MPHINLLPWREELRARRQKEFGVLAGVAVLLMGVIVGGVHLQYNNWIDFQKKRNDFLESEIKKLDKKIEEIQRLDEQKQNLIARMEIIQQLQSSRPEIVHVFDELVQTLPEGVYFQKITQQGREFTIQGIAQSNARVSSLMRELDGSDWLEDPGLLEIKADDKAGGEQFRLSSFGLKIKQTNPQAEAAEAQARAGDKGTTQ